MKMRIESRSAWQIAVELDRASDGSGVASGLGTDYEIMRKAILNNSQVVRPRWSILFPNHKYLDGFDWHRLVQPY